MPPIITTTIEETRDAIGRARGAERSVGLVPTMGALHAGHVSLIQAARSRNDLVVVSIFVNPTQFGPSEDLARYPRPFAADVRMCDAEGVDVIFQPTPEVLYPAGYHTFVEVHDLQEPLCGASRPGHFRGVATIVLKLFNIVQPTRAYFGQKDAQQARILQQMARDLNVPTEISICPIVREPDGLAMSSRNVYLSAAERSSATVLIRTLEAIQERIAAGERRSAPLLALAKSRIEATPGARIDYLSIVNFDTLHSVEELRGQVLIALAVFFGTTRLIDNMLLTIP